MVDTMSINKNLYTPSVTKTFTDAMKASWYSLTQKGMGRLIHVTTREVNGVMHWDITSGREPQSFPRISLAIEAFEQGGNK
jgi:hypothetical protein